jgi:hypothetical protein
VKQYSSRYINDLPALADMPQYDSYHESFENDAAWGDHGDEHDAATWIDNAK